MNRRDFLKRLAALAAIPAGLRPLGALLPQRGVDQQHTVVTFTNSAYTEAGGEILYHNLSGSENPCTRLWRLLPDADSVADNGDGTYTWEFRYK